MDLYARDNRNSTPLHWACFSMSEVALVYLLGWYDKEKLNLKDQDGYTPLHLTVKSADRLKSGRPLRALLMKGAVRNIHDNNGHTPLDLSDELQSRKLAKELKESLTAESTCNCLMLKATLQKTERSMDMPFAFLVLFNLIFIILFLFLFPRWKTDWAIYITSMGGILSMIFWFKT